MVNVTIAIFSYKILTYKNTKSFDFCHCLKDLLPLPSFKIYPKG